ncbi:DUF7742 family protein [Flavimaricola marinus]|uniref:DUF7742 family protein n=1 Tax=Flavimaricola marinus TaxID=1819565 RepID=UPI003F99DF5B
MRPVLPSDLDACARALMQGPACERAIKADGILHAADLADRFRKRTGRLHPDFGDGSLGAAAWRAGQVPRPPRCDSSYCECLTMMLERLSNWRSRMAGGREDHTS